MAMIFMLPEVKLLIMSEKLSFSITCEVLFLNFRLLDDVQRLNINKLKWEHITTLTGPIAAWFV